MINKDDKIYVAGHRGLVGSAIMANMKQRGYTNVIGRTHAELDLLDPVAVAKFFDQERPVAVSCRFHTPEPGYTAKCNR